MLNPKQRLLGVVLCGGRSSRMGRDKSRLAHDSGRTFLDQAVHRLRNLCEEVAVSTSPATSSVDLPDIIQLEDPVSHQGPMVGVAKCVAHAKRCGFAGCLFTPVDMPDLIADDLCRLRDAWIREPDKIVCAADGISGHPEPLVAIYPVSLADALVDAASSDDRSLLRWIKRYAPILVRLAPDSGRNVNSPEDL